MSKTSEKLDAVAAVLGAMSERLDAIEHRLDAQVVTVNMGTASGGMSREEAVRVVEAIREAGFGRACADVKPRVPAVQGGDAVEHIRTIATRLEVMGEWSAAVDAWAKVAEIELAWAR